MAEGLLMSTQTDKIDISRNLPRGCMQSQDTETQTVASKLRYPEFQLQGMSRTKRENEEKWLQLFLNAKHLSLITAKATAAHLAVTVKNCSMYATEVAVNSPRRHSVLLASFYT